MYFFVSRVRSRYVFLVCLFVGLSAFVLFGFWMFECGTVLEDSCDLSSSLLDFFM